MTNKIRVNGHAWNQVKIAGIWYNVDLTWDRHEIIDRQSSDIMPSDILNTDAEFLDHIEYERKRLDEKCVIPVSKIMDKKISSEMIDELIVEYLQSDKGRNDSPMDKLRLITGHASDRLIKRCIESKEKMFRRF